MAITTADGNDLHKYTHHAHTHTCMHIQTETHIPVSYQWEMLLQVILQDTAGRVPEAYGEEGNEGERKLRKRGGIGR